MSSDALNHTDIVCPICLDIFVEPITLVCDHELCKPCYEEHFQKANFCCPLCKRRLSTWARQKTRDGTLVNVAKWKKIQEQFSDLVQNRLCGRDSPQLLIPHVVRVAKPGEIHEEYLKLRQQWEENRTVENNEQEAASLSLIQKILCEEKIEMEQLQQEQMKKDEELAKVLSKHLDQTVPPSLVNGKLLRSVTKSVKKVKRTDTKKSTNSIEKYFPPKQDRTKQSPECSRSASDILLHGSNMEGLTERTHEAISNDAAAKENARPLDPRDSTEENARPLDPRDSTEEGDFFKRSENKSDHQRYSNLVPPKLKRSSPPNLTCLEVAKPSLRENCIGSGAPVYPNHAKRRKTSFI